MGIKRRTRIWTTVGTAALIGSLAGCSDPAPQDSETTSPPAPAQSTEPATADNAAEPARTAPTFAEGEGEGEGGGGGGEFGIDASAAAEDPVVYLIALEVMRAHYLAGIDALQAGNRTAGAEMFAHAISEIYVDFEPALAERSAPDFGEALTEASVAPYTGESDAEIAARVETVLAAIDEAAGHAPQDERSPAAVHGEVLADLIERAVLQYEVAANDPDAGDAYLDGYGFTRAARRYADRTLTAVEQADAVTAAHIETGLGLLEEAYPTALPADTLHGDADRLSAAAAQIHAGVKNLR